MRSASWTPRRWIPTSTRPSVPPFSSTICRPSDERAVERARVEDRRGLLGHDRRIYRSCTPNHHRDGCAAARSLTGAPATGRRAARNDAPPCAPPAGACGRSWAAFPWRRTWRCHRPHQVWPGEAATPIRAIGMRFGALDDAASEGDALVGGLTQRAARRKVRDHDVESVAPAHLVRRRARRLRPRWARRRRPRSP